jgi:hypothetical protein
VLFPLTITALNQSGDALEGATIEVVDALNEDAPVDVYDIDGQVIASPVTDPDGMADLYLRNGYVQHRFTQGLYTSRWVTDLALAPPGRAGRWQDDVGGTITAGTTTDFTITVPNLGVREGAAIPGSAATPPSGSFSGTVTFDDINVDDPPPDPIVLSDGLMSTTVGGRTVGLGLRFWQSAPPDLPGYYAEGAWKLRFVDTGTAGGTLNNWTLTFPPNL